MEQWQVAFREGEFESPIEVQDFPFLERKFSDQEIAESLAVDFKGQMHASLHGMPVMNEETGKPHRCLISTAWKWKRTTTSRIRSIGSRCGKTRWSRVNRGTSAFRT